MALQNRPAVEATATASIKTAIGKKTTNENKTNRND